MTKKKWNQKELKEFEQIIINKRQTVLKNIEEARERADDIIKEGNQSSIYSSHMADAGSDQQSLEHAYSIINRESSFLNYLDLALQRIDDSSFGVCLKCDKLISKDRLKEVPHATKCFNCKTSNH
jgi:RNA polymerase-binding protein DksA